MKYIGKNKSYFIFFNGKYYFSLNKYEIENGWNLSYRFVVNNYPTDLDHDPELKEKYHAKEISNKEINKNIEIIKEKFLELIL